MDETAVREWVDGYVRAWTSNGRDEIASLFTEDAVYYPEPGKRPLTTRDGIVQGWLERKDEPGEWTFEVVRVWVAGDRAFVRAVTGYSTDPPRTYENLWEIRLESDGRCSEFVEWFDRRKNE
jgi:uncharacterized protein (TIGR02246 family)